MDRTRNSIIRGVVCAAIVLCCVNALPGVEFAGGTGEPNDPYQIATAEQLVAISLDLKLPLKHFVLTASIDLPAITWSEPVIPFLGGSLDGNGYAIRGLVAQGVEPQGLFGQITNTGRVMNLRVVDVDLVGVNAVGALAAYNAGTILNCHSTGRIIGVGFATGGLVGSSSGFIMDSSNAVEVTGHDRVGGLVGRNEAGILTHCANTATVIGNVYIGGLVGENGGSISASYSDGEVMGGSDLGGLVGHNTGGISSCYSAGTVAGRNDAGGLVGVNSGRILSCYSITAVTGLDPLPATTVGGLVGRASGGSARIPVADSYFLAPAAGGGPDNKIGIPLTAAQMAQQAGFVGWDFWGTDTDGMADRWFMPAGSSPVLAWQTPLTGLQRVPNVSGLPLDRARTALAAAGFSPADLSYDFHRTYPADFVIHTEPHSVAPVGAAIGLVLSTGTAYNWSDNPGDGTEANPIQIQTAGQLESLGDHPELWDKHIVLTADLDMAGRTYSTALIAPDTSRLSGDFQGTPFTGVLDGQGHMIRGLTILADTREYVGLFGMVGPAGHISRLTLWDGIAKIPNASASAAILVGYNEGTLADCSVFDSVLIASTFGDGLVGVNRGNVVNCHADVTVVTAYGARR